MFLIYKGFQLARALDTKAFYYGGERLPAHVTNYKMAESFIDAFLIPKMTELGLYSGCWKPFFDDYSILFPEEHAQVIKDEIKNNWFYYKEKENGKSR